MARPANFSMSGHHALGWTAKIDLPTGLRQVYGNFLETSE